MGPQTLLQKTLGNGRQKPHRWVFSLKVGQSSEIADVGKHKLVWHLGGNMKRNFQASWDITKIFEKIKGLGIFISIKDFLKSLRILNLKDNIKFKVEKT